MTIHRLKDDITTGFENVDRVRKIRLDDIPGFVGFHIENFGFTVQILKRLYLRKYTVTTSDIQIYLVRSE